MVIGLHPGRRDTLSAGRNEAAIVFILVAIESTEEVCLIENRVCLAWKLPLPPAPHVQSGGLEWMWSSFSAGIARLGG